MSTRKNRGEYAGATLATLADLRRCLAAVRQPVVLLEGTRALPPAGADRLAALGSKLARLFPEAVFRTGNAEGSDTAFAGGVASVDAARIEYIVPHAGMGKKRRCTGSRSVDLSTLPVTAETRLEQFTVTASPQTARLVRHYRGGRPGLRQRGPRHLPAPRHAEGGRGRRGGPGAGLGGAVLREPGRSLAGGTGHTIRVCNALAVPVAFQHTWLRWLDDADGARE